MSSQEPVVLIAEDNPGLARVLSYKFKQAGFACVICGDGQAAWQAFQSHHVKAVISDQEMPRMCGVELFRKIHTSDPYVPLFLITGHQHELAESGIEEELNVAHIFGKPFSPTAVIEKVTETIELQAAEGKLKYAQRAFASR